MYNLDNDSFLNSLEAMAMPSSSSAVAASPRWPPNATINEDSDV